MVLRRKTLALTIIFSFALVVGLISAFAVPVKAQSGTPLTLYAGEVSSSAYGFGNSANSITSPGPTLTLVEGTTYTITVYNVSHMSMLHSWEIVPTEAASSSPLWGAGIDLTNYIPVGGSGSITFTPTQTGNFYYVCSFPGHIALGMWGKVVVQSTIPEFPSVLTLMFMALAVTGLAAFLTKQKTTRQKPKIKAVF
jgi:plastocyanin